MSSKLDRDPIPYKEIINYLNEKAERKFKYSTSKTKSLIKSRWNEGFRLDDFKRAIDNKVDEWKDTDMGKFLRPETLFGNKFDGYVNQGGGDAGGSEYDDFF